MLELLAFGPGGWGDEMLTGAAMTVAVATAAFLLGVGFGALGAWAKLSDNPYAFWPAEAYTTLARGVPELLVIYLLFFGGGGVATAIGALFGYEDFIEPNAFTVGVLAVGAISGAYSTEVLRGAVKAVPKGQIEAARACGMSPWLIFRRVLAPLTLRYALAGLGNVWQLTLKDTALISVTALAEIMRMSNIAANSTRQPFLFYMTAMLLYLALSTGSTFLFERAERRTLRGVRGVTTA
jgi:octopine/nopaline transport system permease protein